MSRHDWIAPVELPSPPDPPGVETPIPPRELPAPPPWEGEPEGAQEPLPPQPRLRPWGRWLLGLLGLFLLTLMGREAVSLVSVEWGRNPWLGGWYALLILAMAATALLLAGRSLRDLGRLRRVGELREEAARLHRENAFGTAEPFAARTVQLYRGHLGVQRSWGALQARADDTLSDREVLGRFSREVLQPLDREAYRVVARHAAGATLMTMVSPLAILDALIVLWRNLAMLRDVAMVYGLRPGWPGSALLLREVVTGMAVAGAGELLADTLSQGMGESVAASLTRRAAPGIANGLFTARLGLRIVAACRPLPFTAEDRAGLGQFRHLVFQRLGLGNE